MLVSMSTTEWSEAGVSELPTGTVTLLLADVEGSTRLWESQPEVMAAAVARLDQALEDPANDVGPTVNRTARLRDLAHGGQTVLSGTTDDLVAEALPEDAWLTDLGAHPLRDLARPQRVVQLCHPDLRNDFPPLRSTTSVAAHHLPAQLTSFVGRHAEMRSLASLDAAWAEGAGLVLEEAVAYAQRGCGERKRPASGWASLPPAERDVARLACEGLANKEIATRLFVPRRTVQAHLSHIYTKLGITSRVQLVRESGEWRPDAESHDPA